MAYLLIPLDDAFVFPGVSASLPIDVGDEERVFLLPRRDGEFGRVGVVAEVVERGRSRGGTPMTTVLGLHRGLAGAGEAGDAEGLRIEVQEVHDGQPDDEHTRELEREYRAVVGEILDLRGDDGRIAAFLRSVEEPGALADTAALSPELSVQQRLRLLETVDVTARLQAAVELQRERLAELQVRSKIRDDVESGAQQQQREYFLRKQMESIRKELGEDETDLIAEYEGKIAEAEMPEAVAEQAEKELRRLERQGEQSPESSMIRSYLDWLIAVPWSKRSDERLDPVHTREVLDADHAGLDDVKRRITEFIAVRKLREDRGVEDDSRANGTILTLVGPPGHRQDLDRRVDRPQPGARVRPHQPRRPARRGRDPRPPPHLHRRPAGTDRPRPARRRDDEPGDPLRRGRQGRRRLARRPVGGAAGGARPGSEPLVPRPLPRRRGRPLRGRLHRHREPRRHDPGAAARPHGD